MSRVDLSVPLESSQVTGVLEEGTVFEGKLCFEGTVRIGGEFRGEIFSHDVLIVGETAKVLANIEAGTVIINGEVIGNINAKHRVEIHRPAVFRGNITTPSLLVDEGVIFEGSSKMVHSRPIETTGSFIEKS